MGNEVHCTLPPAWTVGKQKHMRGDPLREALRTVEKIMRTSSLLVQGKRRKAFQKVSLTEFALLGLGHGLPAPGPLEHERRDTVSMQTLKLNASEHPRQQQ